MSDTICAVSTAQGAGAVAIIRISGPDAWKAAKVLSKKDFEPAPSRVYLTKIYDGEAVLDKVLLTFFKAPASFTGEDIAEIACHGSSYIKGRIIELLISIGVRPAKGGEFSMRAFTNGKMDLLEAQGLCDLIVADNKKAHGAAMNSMEGKVSERFKNIKNLLSDLLAQIEVRLDDVDEEMDAINVEDARSVLQSVRADASALAETFRTGRLVKEGIKVSIVGMPNVGKSSLLNSLLGFDRAIVSDISGTTRDTVEDSFEHNGHKIILTDTAGIRSHTLDAAEKQGMARSMASANRADVILFTVDSTHVENTEEQNLWHEVNKLNKKIILVLNKIDSGTILKETEFEGYSAVIKVSAKTGEGIDALKQAVINILDVADVESSAAIITSAIQYDALVKTVGELDLAEKTLVDNTGLEFCAEHIRRVLFNLKEIIGEVYADDILGIIFSKFCVGK
ncbi:tRNA modification GTPase [Elusimicrobium posterum]|uniref:tRNA uridine-5-carboxymethylaminomethyl(34) synthesis GTPase MnmE n=1 Tax=Elusimicrobium posterum TaxID=3116653 RepID=UPI003C791C54